MLERKIRLLKNTEIWGDVKEEDLERLWKEIVSLL